MIKSAFFALLISGLCCYGIPNNYYSYFPSKTYAPAPTLYNFKVYETPQYQSTVNFSDACAQPNNQLHAEDKKYYQINFDNGPFRLNNLVLNSQAGTNEYVTKYKLKGSLDNQNWFDINDGLEYIGLKNDADTSKFYFIYTLAVKYLRFYPTEYFGCLRFTLIVYFDDNSNAILLPERNRIFINSYKLPDNQTVTPGSATVPTDYDMYKTDKFNNVYYYSNKTDVASRNTGIESSHQYNDTEGNSPYALLQDKNILNEILGSFFDNGILKDPVFSPAFTSTNPAVHKKLVVEFFSQMLGGNVQYTGKSMEEAHRGMAIIDAEFDRFVSLISKAFAQFNVNENIIQEVVRRLETYRKEVVNK